MKVIQLNMNQFQKRLNKKKDQLKQIFIRYNNDIPKELWIKYNISHKEYRNIYQKWLLSRKRGNTKTLEHCVENRTNPTVFKTIFGKGSKEHRIRRQYRIALATPKWINIEDLIKIYINKPDGYHVDHIIPLYGENVSGLHVPWNLQYLKAEDNLKKSNSY